LILLSIAKENIYTLIKMSIYLKRNKLAAIFLVSAISISALFCLNSCGTNVSAEEFEKLKNSGSISELNEFINKNQRARQLPQVIMLRDQLIFDSVSRINTKDALDWFILNYPEAEQVGKAKQKIEELKGIRAVISTFRGNAQRNYYGDKCPSRLDEIWTANMGSGKSFAYGKMYVWTGAGWTGQPLIVQEDSLTYIIQGCFDYHLKKIDAQKGKLIWQYKFNDIIKGTGSIWINRNAENKDERVIVMQGSRRGEGGNSTLAPSYRAVSYFSGKELWRLNSKRTASYSRDVDGSALTLGDTAYIGLENAIFTVFDPNPQNGEMREGIFQPKILQETNLWTDADIKAHGGNLVIESSPTYLNGKIYIVSGSGHVYGYNLASKKVDWDFYIGADMDGSAPVTNDSCLLVSVEKEYIKGHGGVFKLDPSKPENEAAVWYFPTGSKRFAFWDGGIIGSVAVNDKYINDNETHLAAFLAIDGFLYVVDHKTLTDQKVLGPDGVTLYPTPKLLFKQYVGASISSPIIVGNRIVACTYEGIFLFEHDKDLKFKLLDKKKDISFEASPIVWNNRIYVVSNTTGLMYCLGEK
jgi:outer membrane protein assembly factor BamB